MVLPRFIRLTVASAVLLSSTVAFAADPAGIPNFHKVSDTLYRGAQPSDASYGDLARMGVKTVLDLRRPEEHSTTGEAKLVEAAGMHYVNIPMTGWEAPTPTQIASVRAVMDTGGVVFVHCKKGKDRTGTVTAIYRMEREGWANDKAYAEAKQFGFNWIFGDLKSLMKNYKVDPAVAAKYASAAKTSSAAIPAVVLATVPDSSAVNPVATGQKP